ncbi:MAG: outer membrane protein assembly factor BamA [Deltaproteobacteria bacterium]|nr:outer membrane protein assembly factor BamA [Deltaproteobacteria bacterium]
MSRLLVVCALMLAVLSPSLASAWDWEDRIGEIRVGGNEKVESEAILEIIRLRTGDILRKEAIAQSIRDTYRLRYFKDVRVEVEDGVDGPIVLIVVAEKPSIRDVVINGNKKVTTEDIKEVMNLRPFSILSEAKVRSNARKVEDLYLEKGFFLAEVDTTITDEGSNEVTITFDIAENKKVLVKEVNLVGCENVKASYIKARLQTKPAGILPGLGQGGTYRRDTLDTDTEIIQYLYSSFGYVDAQVSKPEVFLSPDKRWVYVTMHVEEGEKYRVGTVDIEGDMIFPKEDLQKLLRTKTGEVYNRVQVAEDVQRVVDKYSAEGFAFANVIPLPRQDRERKVIDLVFDVAKGNEIHLEDVVITGNLSTWDKVIRREVPMVEGQLFRGNDIERTRRRLERLGYFEEVKITTPRGSDPDTLDLAIDVTEKPTGTFSLGAGFSTTESFVFTANISRANFLGLGYTMSLNANLSLGRNLVERGFFNGENSQQQISFSIFDPYFLDTRWTASLSIFSVNRTYQVSEFSRGLNVSFGHYIGKNDDAQASLRYSLETVGLTSLRETQKRQYGGQLYRSGTKSSLTASLIWDKRDNRITPTKGFYLTGSAELAGGFGTRANEETGEAAKVVNLLGGDFRFLRLQANWRFFYPLGTPLLVFRWNLSVGYVKSLDGTLVPFTERYRSGGINSIRGFQPLSLGPQVRYLVNSDPVHSSRSIPIGGTASLVNNLEIEFPIIPPAQVRGVVFFDSGNAFGGLYGTEPFNPANIRLSAGFGVRWRSPMGPLRFEWGFPINRKPGEQGQVFEFTIGSFF